MPHAPKPIAVAQNATSILEVLSNATKVEKFLMSIAVVAAIGHGGTVPTLAIPAANFLHAVVNYKIVYSCNRNYTQCVEDYNWNNLPQ